MPKAVSDEVLPRNLECYWKMENYPLVCSKVTKNSAHVRLLQSRDVGVAS